MVLIDQPPIGLLHRGVTRLGIDAERAIRLLQRRRPGTLGRPERSRAKQRFDLRNLDAAQSKNARDLPEHAALLAPNLADADRGLHLDLDERARKVAAVAELAGEQREA